MCLDFAQQRGAILRDPRLHLGRQILVRKIDRGLEMRQQPQQPLAPAAIQGAEPAFELAQRLAALRLGFGGGEVGHRLGLGQIELAVEEGAAGEFSGLGEAQAAPAECRDDRGQHGAAAMQVQFRDILAGDAVGSGEPQRQPVIDALAGIGIAHPHMPREPSRRQTAGKRLHGRPGLGAGEADNGDGGAPRRGRRGVDRVGRRLAGPQCFGGKSSGCSISRSTRPPFLTWTSRISSMSAVFS